MSETAYAVIAIGVLVVFVGGRLLYFKSLEIAGTRRMRETELRMRGVPARIDEQITNAEKAGSTPEELRVMRKQLWKDFDKELDRRQHPDKYEFEVQEPDKINEQNPPPQNLEEAKKLREKAREFCRDFPIAVGIIAAFLSYQSHDLTWCLVAAIPIWILIAKGRSLQKKAQDLEKPLPFSIFTQNFEHNFCTVPITVTIDYTTEQRASQTEVHGILQSEAQRTGSDGARMEAAQNLVYRLVCQSQAG